MPKPVQRHVLSILALNAEVAIIRHKIKRNSGVTGIYQLQFWKDALNSVYGNKPGPAPRQPVITALRAFVPMADLELLQKLVSARTETLGDRPFVNLNALEKNSDAIYGSLINLMAQVSNDNSNGRSKVIVETASSMGKAVGIVNLLRATIPLLNEGIVLLPTDLLSIYGLSEEDIYRNKKPEKFKQMSKEICEISRHHLRTARSHRDSIDKRIRPAFLSTGAKTPETLPLIDVAIMVAKF